MAARIKFRTAGSYFLAAATLTATLPTAHAADLTISNQRNSAVDTATGDGTGPGNIAINSNGTVSVTSGTAVTINSNNSLTNAGAIQNIGELNATGVLVNLSQNLTGNVTNTGGIGLPGAPISGSNFNTNAFSAGIRVTGPGTLTGNITNDIVSGTNNSGDISVGGASSYGIALQSSMVGSITNHGSVGTVGARSFGIMTTDNLTGSVINTGGVSATGQDSVAIYLGGGVSGEFANRGSILAGAGSQLIVNRAGTGLIPSEPVSAQGGLWVASNVGGGLLNVGNFFTNAQQAADPAKANATPADAVISVVGSGPALQIKQGGPSTVLANITVGERTADAGYSFVNAGVISAAGSVKGLSGTAINIEGLTSGGVNYTTRLVGGIHNAGGDINAVALDGVVTAIHIGNFASVPVIVNSGDIIARTSDSTNDTTTGATGNKGGDAYAILIESQGSLQSIVNTGNIIAGADGLGSSAFGIIDRSGTISSFTNTGTITPSIPTLGTGSITAIDFGARAGGLTFSNTGTITGAVKLGGGDHAFTMSGGGKILGDVSFQSGATKAGNNALSLNNATISGRVGLGNGNHAVALANNAIISRGFSQGTGTLTLSLDKSQVTLFDNQTITASSVTVSNGSTLGFAVGGVGSTTTLLSVSGQVTVSADSKISATFDGILTGARTYDVIQAGNLAINGPLSQIAIAPTSFINAASFALSATNPNILQLTVQAKTAQELNLGPNMTAFYGIISTALNQDTVVAAAIANQPDEAAFKGALQKLMPDTSGALLQAAINSSDLTAGAIRRRLIAVAKNGAPDHALGDVPSFWVQALGDSSDQKAKGEQPGYNVWGLGIALGADTQLTDHTTLGFSFTESWHSAGLNVLQNSPIQFYSTQANLYAHVRLGELYVQAFGGAAYDQFDQTRRVKIGTLNRTAVGKWNGYQWNGSAEVGYAAKIDAFKFTPFARVTYVKLHEDAYTEKSGGAGINLAVRAKNATSARGSLGFMLDRDFPIFYDSYVEAELRGNFTREFKKDPYTVTAAFAAGGPSFTNISNARNPNRFAAGFGVAHKDSYSSVSVDYDAEISRGFISHVAAVTIRFRF